MTEHFTVNDVINVLREEVEQTGGQREWSQRHGVSFKWLNNVLQGYVKPGPTICLAIGFRKVTTYVPVNRR